MTPEQIKEFARYHTEASFHLEGRCRKDCHICSSECTRCSGELYWCPTVEEFESVCHSGFDVCCIAPEKHIPVKDQG